MPFVKAIFPAPLFSTPDIAKAIQTSGHIRELEMTAPLGSIFSLVETLPNNITKVYFEEYSKDPLYVDSRFLEESVEPTPQKKICPPKESILAYLKNALGSAYVWGSNHFEGVQRFEELYGTSLKGVDCSGLLYEATSGFTPRNTSGLISFGIEVKIEEVEPLDIIVWRGHVVIVLNKDETIESQEKRGVVVYPIKERLAEIKRDVKQFYIRRWYVP